MHMTVYIPVEAAAHFDAIASPATYFYGATNSCHFLAHDLKHQNWQKLIDGPGGTVFVQTRHHRQSVRHNFEFCGTQKNVFCSADYHKTQHKKPTQ